MLGASGSPEFPPRGTADSPSTLQLLSLRSLCLSLSGLLTTPTPGSPASPGLLTAPLLLLLLPLFLRPLCLLGLPASWPGARPATTAAGAVAAAAAAAPGAPNGLNPTPAGPEPSASSEGGAVEGGVKGEEFAGRPGIPLLVGTCCHWPTETEKSGRELTTRGSAGCPPPHKQPVRVRGLLRCYCHLFTGFHCNSMRPYFKKWVMVTVCKQAPK